MLARLPPERFEFRAWHLFAALGEGLHCSDEDIVETPTAAARPGPRGPLALEDPDEPPRPKRPQTRDLSEYVKHPSLACKATVAGQSRRARPSGCCPCVCNSDAWLPLVLAARQRKHHCEIEVLRSAPLGQAVGSASTVYNATGVRVRELPMP